MEVRVAINGRGVAVLALQRTDAGGDPTPRVGTGSYRATLYTLDGVADAGRETWEVRDHDRATGVWGLVADALAQRPPTTGEGPGNLPGPSY
jgi:hypothetical protein